MYALLGNADHRKRMMCYISYLISAINEIFFIYNYFDLHSRTLSGRAVHTYNPLYFLHIFHLTILTTVFAILHWPTI